MAVCQVYGWLCGCMLVSVFFRPEFSGCTESDDVTRRGEAENTARPESELPCEDTGSNQDSSQRLSAKRD